MKATTPFPNLKRPYAIKKLKKAMIAVTAIIKSMDCKAVRLRT
jgi:hypothetical protein